MIDWIEIQDRILSLVSIEDIITKYTSNKIVRNRTNCINSNCSGVQERTMSLKKGYAYCFRCGKNYNQIQTVMELQKCDYITACKMIIADFGLPIEIDKPLTAKEKKEYAEKRRTVEREKRIKQYWKNAENIILRKVAGQICECEEYIFEEEKNPLIIRVQNLDTTIDVHIRLDKLLWINDVLCCNEQYDLCEYDAIYTRDKIKLIENILNGDISL